MLTLPVVGTFVEVFIQLMIYYDILLFNGIYYVLSNCYFLRVFNLASRVLTLEGGRKAWDVSLTFYGRILELKREFHLISA